MAADITLRIAVVSDDEVFAERIGRKLKARGHVCRCFKKVTIASDLLSPRDFDAALVVQSAAKYDVSKLLLVVRNKLGYALPVVAMVSSSEKNILSALRGGADTCLVHETSMDIVTAQIDALLHRFFSIDISVGHISFDKVTQRALVDNRFVALTTIEYSLAVLLCTNVNKLLSRDIILSTVWGRDDETRSLDVHASRLRVKLRLTEDSGFRLASVYNRGYKLIYNPPRITLKPSC